MFRLLGIVLLLCAVGCSTADKEAETPAAPKSNEIPLAIAVEVDKKANPDPSNGDEDPFSEFTKEEREKIGWPNVFFDRGKEQLHIVDCDGIEHEMKPEPTDMKMKHHKNGKVDLIVTYSTARVLKKKKKPKPFG